MSTTNNPFALIPQDADTITGVGRAELQAYINQKYANVPAPILASMLYACYVRNLNPLLNHIYITSFNVKQKDGSYKPEYALVTSIDSFRLIAQRTGQYAGKKAPLYLKESGKWEDFVLEGEKYIACRITVLKSMPNGVIVETTCDAYMDEYNKKRNLWLSIPKHMIAKCAEALALRTAFPDELTGLYTEDEMRETSLEEVKTVDYQEKAREFVKSIANIMPTLISTFDCEMVTTEKDFKGIRQAVYEYMAAETLILFRDEVRKESFKKWYAMNSAYTPKAMESITTAYIRLSNPIEVVSYEDDKIKSIVDTLEGMESQTERIDFVKGIDQHYKAHPDVKEVLSKYSLSDGN